MPPETFEDGENKGFPFDGRGIYSETRKIQATRRKSTGNFLFAFDPSKFLFAVKVLS